ncbi:target of rapamycin complex 2 subunit MAPKAP1-like [Tubulanus polymorphus]|uniref:target of rapamycin complex 2 subunit MAPKAP1-like n=1 Tax=Tubulanus polymorphus TaxID=672921 RepID=UPI003DA2BB3C
MAMLDNRAFLISHLRKSFITSDDTQMCEIIIRNEELTDDDWDPLNQRWKGVCDDGYKNPRDPDIILANSPDVLPSFDSSRQRRRSRTQTRLDKLKTENKRQKLIQHIQWKETTEFTDEDLADMFTKKSLIKNDDNETVNKTKTVKSALSTLLENTTGIDNPFKEYSQYDCSPGVGQIPVKTIDIYLTMQSEEERCYPMTVTALASTPKIRDFIGLICWQYFNEGRQPKLSGDVSMYDLYIAEDDGEPDLEFKIDSNEPFAKFMFDKLCLVETRREKQQTNEQVKVFVNITIQGRGKTTLAFDNKSVLMKDIHAQVIKKRNMRRRGAVYNLEKDDEPGIPVDLEKCLSDMDTTDFYLFRENSQPRPVGQNGVFEKAGKRDSTDVTYAQQYKSYRVSMPQKFFGNKEVHLGISGEKIEIDPVSKGITKYIKQKAVSYEFDCVAHCEMLEAKSAGKAAFRLHVLVEIEEVCYDFEADIAIIKEIVQKINQILEMRGSPIRKYYLDDKSRRNSGRFFVN